MPELVNVFAAVPPVNVTEPPSDQLVVTVPVPALARVNASFTVHALEPKVINCVPVLVGPVCVKTEQATAELEKAAAKLPVDTPPVASIVNALLAVIEYPLELN